MSTKQEPKQASRGGKKPAPLKSSLAEPWQPDSTAIPDLQELQHLQPTLNVGLIGHVAHGKSTIVRQLSGFKTGTHSTELERNMTIKLGYANTKIYRCPECPRPSCYQAYGSAVTKPKCVHCDFEPLPLVRHVSFVDCPGHEVLMATMLNAAAAMDGAVLVVAANEVCPQPQTAEHLAAAELTGLKHIFPIQNKIDLIDQESARAHYASMRELTKGTAAQQYAPIPIAAQYGINVDVLIEYLAEKLPHPERDLTAPACLQAIRSFDINKPGTPFASIKGAVLGGTLSRGVLRVGDVVEVRPGLVRKDEHGIMTAAPLFTKVTSMSSEKNPLQVAVPGGLIGVGTHIDSSLAKDDGLVGQVLGPVGTLAPVYQDIQIKYRLMHRLLGTEEGQEIAPLSKGDQLLMHVGSNTTLGTVMSISTPSSGTNSLNSSTASAPTPTAKKAAAKKAAPAAKGTKAAASSKGTASKGKDKSAAASTTTAASAEASPPSSTDKDEESGSSSSKRGGTGSRTFNIRLTQMPVCASVGDRVAFSRAVGSGHFRLIGFGTITSRSRPLALLDTYRPPEASVSS